MSCASNQDSAARRVRWFQVATSVPARVAVPATNAVRAQLRRVVCAPVNGDIAIKQRHGRSTLLPAGHPLQELRARIADPCLPGLRPSVVADRRVRADGYAVGLDSPRDAPSPNRSQPSSESAIARATRQSPDPGTTQQVCCRQRARGPSAAGSGNAIATRASACDTPIVRGLPTPIIASSAVPRRDEVTVIASTAPRGDRGPRASDHCGVDGEILSSGRGHGFRVTDLTIWIVRANPSPAIAFARPERTARSRVCWQTPAR
jgi:hypothetical protein